MFLQGRGKGGGVELELVLILMAHRQNHTLDVAPKHANPINRFLRLFGLQISGVFIKHIIIFIFGPNVGTHRRYPIKKNHLVSLRLLSRSSQFDISLGRIDLIGDR